MYRFVESFNEKANISAEYVALFERTYEISIPPVLKDYYLRFNGARIKECRFERHGLEFCVIRLFPLNYGTMPVEKILKYNSRNDAVPNSFIPLALDEDEDDYYWDNKTKKVYYLSFGNVEHPIPICDSVEEFFEILNNC